MKLFLFVLLVPLCAVHANVAQVIDLPYSVVTGIATEPGYLWAMSVTPQVLFQLDATSGDLLATVPYSFSCTDPVGLAYTPSALYFAEKNTPTLVAISESGSLLGSWDLSLVNPEITSISGLGINYFTYPGTNDELVIADNVSKKIFLVGPLGQFDQAVEWIDLSGMPVVGDVSCNDSQRTDAVVCYGTGVLSFWTPPSHNYLTIDYSYEGVTNITTITQEHGLWGMSFEFTWAYDQTDNALYLLYHGLALEKETWGGLKTEFE
jgi:hypothetical protein